MGDRHNEHEHLVHAYWRHYSLNSGDRAQRLTAAEVTWAWDEVEDTVRAAPLPVLLDLLEELLAAPNAEPAYLGAGPLEDLLHQQPQAADAVAQRCRSSPVAARWRDAVAAVWLTGHEHDRLPALAAYLSAPIDRR